MPKMFSTPSAERLFINASAALIFSLIGLAMVPAGLCAASRGFGRVPAGVRIDRALDRVALIALDHVDDRLDQLLAEQGRLQAEVEQLGVDRVVVVLFLLHARVVAVLDLYRVAEVVGGERDQVREVDHRELLGELVEDAELARLGGVVRRQLDALQGVADVEEAARLPPRSVDGQRGGDHGLQAEAVEHGAEDLVVVEAGNQALVAGGLVGLDPVDDALVEIGRAQAPGAAGEVDVGRVVDLRAVVERGRQLREGKRVAAALVLDPDIALLDIDVGLAVLAHRAELHQVALGDMVANREEQIEVADHVAVLGLDRLLPGGHRVGRRSLLPVVDNDLGPHLRNNAVAAPALLDRPDEALDLVAAQLPPGAESLLERAERGQRVAAHALHPAAADEIVDDGYLVTAGREAQGGGPTEVTVAPED